MEFLLNKDKEKKRKHSPQKQECGCSSLPSSRSKHTYAFFADPLAANNTGFGIKTFTNNKN